MKQFFKFLLASTLGTFLAIFLAVIFFIASIVGLISSMEEEQDEMKVKENTVLDISWKNEIKDRTSDNPFENFSLNDFDIQKPIGLDKILKTIDRAKDDERIAGILLDMESLPAGSATMEEIRNKLKDFKKSGKFVYSYANLYDQKAYYLATVSDKIFMNPEGFILFKGLNVKLVHIKNLLDKIGIKAQVIRGPNNKYKSAVEPLIYEKSSKANIEQTQELINVVWNNILDAVSETRGLDKDKLNEIADNLELETAQKAKKYNFIDDIFYRDQLYSFLRKKMSVNNLNIVDFNKYALRTKDKNRVKTRNSVAVIYAEGSITQGKGKEDEIGSESLSETIRKVRENEHVKAIVLRVNSPGGDALAAEVIRRELELAAEKVPLIISMGNLAASGGYWISTPGKFIFSDNNTITGSIGVFGVIPNMQELFNDKLGVTFDGVKTNKNADFIDVMKPMSYFQKEKLNRLITRTYNNFVTLVANSRHLDKNYVDSIARGRVWVGADALKVGLVDSIGGLQSAVKYAALQAGLSSYRVREYPREKQFIEKLLEGISGDVETKLIKSSMGNMYKYYNRFKSMEEMQGIQARLPYLIYDIN